MLFRSDRSCQQFRLIVSAFATVRVGQRHRHDRVDRPARLRHGVDHIARHVFGEIASVAEFERADEFGGRARVHIRRSCKIERAIVILTRDAIVGFVRHVSAAFETSAIADCNRRRRACVAQAARSVLRNFSAALQAIGVVRKHRVPQFA